MAGSTGPPHTISGQAQRHRAEDIALRQVAQSQKDFEAMSPEEMRWTLHELRVHQIEREMQNEELHRAQAELDAERGALFRPL